jgi:predicted nucleic acid-binding protein
VDAVVVDASVVVKWYLSEPGRETALRLREDYVEGKLTLHAPSLMPYEVLNAVRYARRDIDVKTLETVAESLSLYGIELNVLRGEYAHLTARVAVENKITVYDAAYIALAKLNDIKLYTADDRLKKTLKSEYQKYVTPIEDYPA